MYIIHNLLWHIINAQHCISSIRRYDARKGVMIYKGGEPPLMIYRPRSDVRSLRRNSELASVYAIAFAMDKKIQVFRLGFFGSPNWARTSDIMINSHALYRLSYRGILIFVPYVLQEHKTNHPLGKGAGHLPLVNIH